MTRVAQLRAAARRLTPDRSQLAADLVAAAVAAANTWLGQRPSGSAPGKA